MERNEFMKHGLVRLPPGFRFHPTDEELVVQYLRRKAFSFPLPAAIIPEIDLGKLNPWDLPLNLGGFGGDKYFFYLRESKSQKKKGRVSYRETKLGYWKPLGKEKPVLASSQGNELVGLKQVLAFYRGKSPHGSKTDWIMHEYSLPNKELLKSSAQSLLVSSKEWVVCQISVKRRKNLRARNIRQEENQIPATSSSSSWSCITENLLDEEDSNGEEAMSKIFVD
ncbi:NAC domain-containing protein 83-like [Phalaenopsis equestris]|uniref:NAC domain-containing protein 83-like n=1 Tax=Phalaenopsis equestris TaxID=78828 RepID=UPI0009E33865|nr:NAC domain-containing protein 83-like [Phalaenopsis equestris]